MPGVIKFYGRNNPYGEFSNFYVRPIVIENVTWPVGTEQYFQAMKSEDPDVQEHIRTKLTRPGEIKDYCSGGAGKVKLRADWDASIMGLSPEALKLFTDEQGLVVDRVKDHIMYQALVAKFTQHADLGKVLLNTGAAFLVEDTQQANTDPYWGNGPAGDGLNKLGRMLMLVRQALPRHRQESERLMRP